ncbi:MAG: hypothetical protein ACOX5R_07765 [bacterium]|jgi:hypothetical protein
MNSISRMIVCLVVLSMLVLANISQAQQRGGAFRSEGGRILADVLLLDTEKAEKVEAAYTESREKQMRDGGSADFRNMSNEERQEWFTKSQKNTVADLKESLKDTLSEEELAVVEDLLMRRVSTPVAELRALRQIDLQDEQRQKLQPAAIELGKKIVPGGFGFFGSRRSDSEREEAEKAFTESKTTFIALVEETLSDEQVTEWKEKTEAVNKEIEERRERMRQRQN